MRRSRPPLNPHIAVRDSKAPGVGTLMLTPEAFGTFVRAAARTCQGGARAHPQRLMRPRIARTPRARSVGSRRREAIST
ncbi:DUF397 domain-containing protein [Streptomyces geranii]|uniref:DUF397 domain-containing protein n=1 Tax=Streptomyces geranii TaxID=2058923 RepID=UPI001E32EA80|nr:DUF397 domain-containing protein [Streptomyces geranii]